VAKPPSALDLTWIGELKFSATSATSSATVDGDGKAGLSPMQSLAAALAGCMAADVVHILSKGRHPLRGVRARLVGERAADTPHRFLSIDLHFVVEGAVPADAIERAIALSHERYCSVWHSMRADIDFRVRFDVTS
jgi:putative redox protein